MKFKIKTFTMTIALFGSMAVYGTSLNAPVAADPPGAGHVYSSQSLPQNDIDEEAAGSFDSTKSQDQYLNAPATTNRDRNRVKTMDMHAGTSDGAIVMGNDSTVMNVQKSLNSLDYQAGSVDGIMGPKTMSAIEKFQRDNNISATGRLNAQTLEALEIDDRSIYNDNMDSETYAE